MYFNIRLRLPVVEVDEECLNLGQLVLQLPQFEHHFHSLESVSFDMVWSKAQATPFRADVSPNPFLFYLPSPHLLMPYLPSEPGRKRE